VREGNTVWIGAPAKYFSRRLAGISQIIQALQMGASSIAAELAVTDIDGRAPGALTLAEV
jgi:hypothetical protein